MRILFVGVSHWHLPLYLDPVLATPGLTVAGVTDRDPGVAAAVAARVGGRSGTDVATIADAVRPDFAIVLGRHDDMAAAAGALVERRIPFAIEKPGGLTVAEIEALAARVRAAGLFAAVPFVFRESRWLETVRTVAAGERCTYLAVKYVAGSTQRYRDTGCEWMLSRASAGGGCLLNLGIHFVDLARLLFGPDLAVAGATVSNAVDGDDVEDHGVLLLRADAGSAVIETGYTFPAPHMAFDLHLSIRTERHYFVATGPDRLDVLDLDRRVTSHAMPITNPPYYPGFVREALARAADGRPPVAGLDDMAEAMRLLDAGYAAAPRLTARRSGM